MVNPHNRRLTNEDILNLLKIRKYELSELLTHFNVCRGTIYHHLNQLLNANKIERESIPKKGAGRRRVIFKIIQS